MLIVNMSESNTLVWSKYPLGNLPLRHCLPRNDAPGLLTLEDVNPKRKFAPEIAPESGLPSPLPPLILLRRIISLGLSTLMDMALGRRKGCRGS